MSEDACPRRRLTVPLTGTGEATLSKLMKDDSAYTFAELPRINPQYKVSFCCLATACCSGLMCAEGLDHS